MSRRNYQKEMEAVIETERRRGSGRLPTLLLHSCCAPCSSAVLERLSPDFDLTVFYYNPNISPRAEYEKRAAELARLIAQMPHKNPIRLITGEYEPQRFYEASAGFETAPEGGERCRRCFALRLEEAAGMCRDLQLDYFTTTLSISPLKNAQVLNEIGEEAASKYGVHFLPSDFKKKNGYRRSVELSREYDLYRQDFCGCEFSRKESEKRRKTAEERKNNG